MMKVFFFGTHLFRKEGNLHLALINGLPKTNHHGFCCLTFGDFVSKEQYCDKAVLRKVISD